LRVWAISSACFHREEYNENRKVGRDEQRSPRGELRARSRYPTTSFLTAATLIYALGAAGITAAAGTRPALQWILVKGFKVCSFPKCPRPVFTAVSGSPAAAAMAMRPSVRPSVRCRSQHDVQRRGRCAINSISSSSWRSHGQRVGGAASVLCAATVASATERSEDNRRRQRVRRA